MSMSHPRRGLLLLGGLLLLLLVLSLACTSASRTFVVTSTRDGTWTCATPTPRPYGRPDATPTPYAHEGTLFALGQTISMDPVAVRARVTDQVPVADGMLVTVRMDWSNDTASDLPVIPQMLTVEEVIDADGQTAFGSWQTTSAAQDGAGIADFPMTLPPGASTVMVPIIIPADSTVAQLSMPFMAHAPAEENLVPLRWRADVVLDPPCPRPVSPNEETLVTDRLPDLWDLADDLDDLDMDAAADAVRDQVDALVADTDTAIDAGDTDALADLLLDTDTAMADTAALISLSPTVLDALDTLDDLANDLDDAGKNADADDVRDQAQAFTDDLAAATRLTDLEDLQAQITAAITAAEELLVDDTADLVQALQADLDTLDDLANDLDDAGLTDDADDVRDQAQDFADELADATGDRDALEDLQAQTADAITAAEELLDSAGDALDDLVDAISDDLLDLWDLVNELQDAGMDGAADDLADQAQEFEDELAANDDDRDVLEDLQEQVEDAIDEAEDLL